MYVNLCHVRKAVIVLVIFCLCAMIVLRGLHNRIKWRKFVRQMLPEEKGEKNTADVITGNTFDPRGNLQAFPRGTTRLSKQQKHPRWNGREFLYRGFPRLPSSRAACDKCRQMGSMIWYGFVGTCTWWREHGMCLQKKMSNLRRSSITGTETVLRNCSRFQASSFWLIRELQGVTFSP